MTFEGKLASLPAGPLVAALGLKYREQRFDDSYGGDVVLPVPADHFRRRVVSASVELNAPILAPSPSGNNAVKVSLAGRFDAYGDVGSTVEPQLRFE